MTNYKTYGSIPQAGQSRTHQRVCLKDSEGDKNLSYPTKLHIATYNIRTLKSPKRLIRLDEELSGIKWDTEALRNKTNGREMHDIGIRTRNVPKQHGKHTYRRSSFSNKQKNKTSSNQNEIYIRKSNLHSHIST